MGTMSFHHFDTIGRAAGEDLVGDDIVPPTKEDLNWFEDIHGMVTNFTELNEVNDISNVVFGPKDLERLQKIWDDEIESRKEFGITQLVNELKEINGVNFEDLDRSFYPAVDPEKAKMKVLQDKLLKARNRGVGLQSRMDGEGKSKLKI